MTDLLDAPSTDPFVVVTTTEDRPNIGGFSSNDDSPLRCEVCGTGLVYGGRGRKPKRCDEHKKGGSSGNAGNRSGSLAALHEPIANLYRGLGFGVSFALTPEDGGEIIANADKFADAWIELAKTDPKVAKMLRNATKSSGWGAVLAVHASVGFRIASRHGALDKVMGRR